MARLEAEPGVRTINDSEAINRDASHSPPTPPTSRVSLRPVNILNRLAVPDMNAISPAAVRDLIALGDLQAASRVTNQSLADSRRRSGSLQNGSGKCGPTEYQHSKRRLQSVRLDGAIFSDVREGSIETGKRQYNSFTHRQCGPVLGKADFSKTSTNWG
jgi:hypothetical protein